jgi:uncharacterized protein (TIGR03437 family)
MKRISIPVLCAILTLPAIWCLYRYVEVPAQATRQTPQNRLLLQDTGLPDYDIRASLRRSQPLDDKNEPKRGFGQSDASRQLQERVSRSSLSRRLPQLQVRWSSLTGAPSRLLNLGNGTLSEPIRVSTVRTVAQQRNDASTAARSFLISNRELFGLDEPEIQSLSITKQYFSGYNGLSHISLGQSLNGIPVFQGVMTVNVSREGAVVSANGELFPRFASAALLSAPELTVEDALRSAASTAGTSITTSIRIVKSPEKKNRAQTLSAGLARDVDAELVYFPLSTGDFRLAWQFQVWRNDTPDAYLVLIDARSGTLLYRYNFTSYDENPLHPHGLVFNAESPTPHNPYTGLDSPPLVPQVDLAFRAQPFLGLPTFAISDPHYDWWAGAAATGLVSNNVDAHLDRDNFQNIPDSPPLEALDGNFSFFADLTAPPTTVATASAAQVNLFYFVNRYHDILYRFGFNEAAGNFQANNFGLGGVGGDAIQADAQDGSGFNNANFSTPPDGSRGRVQMYLWDAFNPNLDGDFDQGVIVHELTHGLSNRLVGNSGGLVGMQARGMGEGWSDYVALTMMRTAADDPDGSYPIGQYVVGKYASGIRRYPYSTSLAVNPLTLGRITDNTEVHAVGEIWCSLLWEMRRLLVDRYGFVEGQRQSLQLVVDGLKLTPPAPTFLDARDAILLADRINNGGSNQCLIGKAFAKRGAGINASSTDSSDAFPVEGFAEAPSCSDTGTVALDRKNYLPGETIFVSLGDRNAPASPTVEVRSSVTGDVLSLHLIPQANMPGSYAATVPTGLGKAVIGDGVLQASADAGDEIRVTYSDASTSNGIPGESVALAGAARESEAFTDDVEHGGKGWVANGTWAVSSSMSASSSHSWRVRSVGNDQYLPSIALASPTIDLSLYTDVTLNFAQSYDLQTGFNYGIIEYSIDEGATWLRARSFTGSSSAFSQASVRLPALDGRKFARVRFVLQNASISSADFWSVDDVSIIGRSTNTTAIPPTLAESPVIDSIVPAWGRLAGDTLVNISGMNFTDSSDTRISFDGIPATEIKVLGESVVTARTPAHVAGPVIVRVMTRRGSSARTSAFTYFVPGTPGPAPTLAQIFPASGSTRGGASITVFGSGFSPDTLASFGGISSPVTYVDSKTLRVTTPPVQSPASVDLQVRNGPQSATLNQAFTYTAPTPPSLQLTNPASNATVFAGSVLAITWNSSDNRSLTKHRLFLEFSAGIGSGQTEIASDLPGSAQSYNWQMAQNQPTTTSARLHIIATDDEGAETEVVSTTAFALSQRWDRPRNLPAPLNRAQAASDGNLLYVAGGRTSTADSSTSSALYRYDPGSNLWTSIGLEPMPQGLNGGEAAFIGGRIFIPGGSSSLGITPNHSAYDIASNTWIARTAPPAGATLYSVAVNSDAGVFYLTGGTSGGPLSTARLYNVSTNAWSPIPSMGTARHSHRSAFINGRLYVAGGVGPGGGLTNCEVFDVATNQWSTFASLNQPRSGATAFLTKTSGGAPLWVLVGGTNPATGQFLGAEAYDIQANRWISLDNSFGLGTQRTYLTGARIGDSFFAAGGANPTQPVNAVERIRIETLNPVMGNTPPVLAVPDFVPVVPGDELQLPITANDLGSGVPLILTATSLPPGAVFSSVPTSNNNVAGLLKWTPAESSKGLTFDVKFTVTDGQFSETKVLRLQVVNATPLAVVNAADFHSGPVSADCLVAGFGSNLAVRTGVAETLPLPFELDGTRVYVNGVPAQIQFVSAGQVNFVVPSGVGTGNASVVLRSGTSQYASAQLQLQPSAPAIFTASQTGSGDAAAVATTDGVNYQNPPFDLTVGGQPNILVLFGTGIRHAVTAQPLDDNGVAEAVTVTIAGQTAPVYYAGAQGLFIGLDQLNVGFPPGLAGGPQRRVEVVVSINGSTANKVTIEIR